VDCQNKKEILFSHSLQCFFFYCAVALCKKELTNTQDV